MPINSFDDYPMTWKPELDKTTRPLYLTLANQLEKDILEGGLLPGTKLPPYRELADFLDINVSTVAKAFKLCILKGFLSATTGSGTFVSFDALSNAYLLSEEKGKNIIELGATMPDSSSYEPLQSQLKNMMNEPDYKKWFGYGRTGDMHRQKEAGIQLINKSGYLTRSENILFANGAQSAISAVLIGLCKHGDKIGADPHTYPGLKTSAGMLGIQLVPIKGKDGEMDEDALIYACKNEGIKGIYLVPDYQNPTTHTMSLERREALGNIAKKHKIFIIEDATYHLICEKPTKAVASFAPDQTIYISGLSKTISPGLRFAYVSVPEQYRQQLYNALYNISLSVSPLMAELAGRIILSGQVENIIKSHREKTKERNRIVNKHLFSYDCLGDDSSIFRWLLLPGNISGAEFEKTALKNGVQVYAAERFTVGNSPPERAVRLSVCAPETEEELEKGIKIIKELLAVQY